MLSPGLARALGVSRQVPAEMVAEYLCRQAEVGTPAKELTISGAEWFVSLAEALGEHLHVVTSTVNYQRLDSIAENVAKEAAARLRRADAPCVLAAIAPEQVVGGCPAGDLLLACRARVGRSLPNFCRRVLRDWEMQGLLIDLSA